jgi:hypothetical protein
MNIPDHISESLETIFWVKKNLNSLKQIRIRDPKSVLPWIRDAKNRIPDVYPGSATLVFVYRMVGNKWLAIVISHNDSQIVLNEYKRITVYRTCLTHQNCIICPK